MENINHPPAPLSWPPNNQDNGAASENSISRAALFALMDDLGIKHTTLDHPPAFTVDDGAEIKAQLAGGHTKNLFLADKSGQLVLVCALASTRVDVNRIHRALNEALVENLEGTQGSTQEGTKAFSRLSFGPPEKLKEILGATPGSVTFLGLINDRSRALTLILDKALLDDTLVNFHPLRNDATTTFASGDMVKWVRLWAGAEKANAFWGDFASAEISLTHIG